MLKQLLRRIARCPIKNDSKPSVHLKDDTAITGEEVMKLLDKAGLRVVSARCLHIELGFTVPLPEKDISWGVPLHQWLMEKNDAPIFRYLYRNRKPRRHLEFGTWYGAGTMFCLQESDATVWTINAAGGEMKPDGEPAYWLGAQDKQKVQSWAKHLGYARQDAYRTDTLGFIGREFLEANLGNRVCQIYCHSIDWDIQNYPAGFFDSALIDGGHSVDVVRSDTNKALSLVRSGGMILWHDFCPSQKVLETMESPRGVMKALLTNWAQVNNACSKLFWIEPSWIMLGIKR